MRLATRFAVLVAILVPVLVLLSGLLVLRLASADLRSERDHRLLAKEAALYPLATTYARQSRRRAAAVENSTAQLASAAVGDGVYVRVTGGDPLVLGAVPDTLPESGSGPGTLRDSGGHLWRYVAADLGVTGAAGRLWVVEPNSQLSSRVSRLRQRLWLATAAAVVLGALAGLLLGRRAVRPLTALRRDAHRAESGARLATGSGVVEVDELAALLNALLDRRDAALETARAFAATAAHELRTPLTSMGANLSLLGHPHLTPAQLDDVIADLTAEHARMQGLVTALRRLAQGELTDPAAFTPVDLADLADAAADGARRRHPGTHVEVAGEGTVRGDAEGLRMVVDNLLDNAAVHGGGRILVTVGPGGLTVDDAGPGIPEAEREAVFERFHRRTGSPGSGLGLTLVRQQAALHGGSVTAGRSPAGGTRIELRLP